MRTAHRHDYRDGEEALWTEMKGAVAWHFPLEESASWRVPVSGV